MLRPLPREADIRGASLLAHAILFRDLHERIPATTVTIHAAENIRDRWLSPVVEGSELNGHLTERDWANLSTMEKFVRRSLTKRVTPDRSKITVTSEIEVRYWIKHFGVTREELARAVERVGNSVASVRKELRNFAPDAH
jgi:hypothetical protein